MADRISDARRQAAESPQAVVDALMSGHMSPGLFALVADDISEAGGVDCLLRVAACQNPIAREAAISALGRHSSLPDVARALRAAATDRLACIREAAVCALEK